MKRLASIIAAAALLLGASGVYAAFPPAPQPGPAIPSEGLSESTWAYGYVPQCCVTLPANTIDTLTTVTVTPGTWRFDANVSLFIDPKQQSVPWSLELHKLGGTAGDYYGGSTGQVANIPTVISASVLGIASFTATTTVELRFTSWGAAQTVPTAAFDSGPTTVLVAQRVSDVTSIP